LQNGSRFPALIESEAIPSLLNITALLSKYLDPYNWQQRPSPPRLGRAYKDLSNDAEMKAKGQILTN